MPHVPWLHAAAGLADSLILEDLLEKGWTPNGRDDLGRTPLFSASSAHQMAHLLTNGADTEAQDNNQESVRRSWARVSPRFAQTIAPVLDSYASPAPVSNHHGLEAHAEGKKADDDKVERLTEDLCRVWKTWKTDGVTVDHRLLGQRGVALLKEQFPESFGSLTLPARRRTP